MDVWFASFNPNKLKELKFVLANQLPEAVLHTADSINGYSAPPENGANFVDNARIKAKNLAAVKPGCWVLGEDSGLVVPAMGGLPGVHSARYAGEKASDSENVAKLLKMLNLRGVMDRSAHLHCSLVCISPDKQEFVFTGELKGKIALKPAGQLGFGYDPVLIPEGQEQTLAELGPAYKNAHSHRSKALIQWIQKVRGEK